MQGTSMPVLVSSMEYLIHTLVCGFFYDQCYEVKKRLSHNETAFKISCLICLPDHNLTCSDAFSVRIIHNHKVGS